MATCATHPQDCDIDLMDCRGCNAGPTHCVCPEATECAVHDD